ncbi:sulfotransferase [Microbulbifer bruguierae]|uniref:Sulfotransferase n=1 Tax=Microbulbifer bruguierae TaxID=3029061 RepID=A0ABY8NB93_9GAMM|nr:tetratricopeptide repeat-containing sulfotransferase family protein [Microbulbifer bruguierae]WGL15852.1 sulfotransferase [Microbulbifer bruguierae]
MQAPSIQQLHASAEQALNRGDMRLLYHSCRQILQTDPAHADAWFLISIAAATAGQVNLALEMIERALQYNSSNTEYLTQKARYHAQLNQYAAAIQTADTALALNPQRPLLLDTLGVVYAKFDEHKKAIIPLRRAVTRAPDNAQFQFNLASTEQFLGNQDAARAAYEKAIVLQPGFARARWALSELEKNSADTARAVNRQKELPALLAQPGLSAEDQLHLSHALARDWERNGNYTASFACLDAAKHRYRDKIGYTFDQDAELFRALKSAFPTDKQANVQNRDGSQGEKSLFIVGMPRSGTTLVERILASHSQIQSHGELHEFPLAIKRHSNTSSPHTLSPDVITAALAVDADIIGRDYIARCRERGKSGARMIDKLPINFLYLGFILRSLPKAKIVVLDRHPLDVCLSNYRQLFSFAFRYYHYHYSLADTARYICAYLDLMAHWKRLFGKRIYTVNYEQLTDNPEREARALMEYMELPWEAECLEFHRADAAVSTASSVQVRQPIYRDAVQRWKKYEKELMPAIEIFRQAGII